MQLDLNYKLNKEVDDMWRYILHKPYTQRRERNKMAKAKNLQIDTKEFKLQGILNAEGIEEGVILLECSDGEEFVEVNVSDIIRNLDGTEVEISIKNKLEQAL